MHSINIILVDPNLLKEQEERSRLQRLEESKKLLMSIHSAVEEGNISQLEELYSNLIPENIESIFLQGTLFYQYKDLLSFAIVKKQYEVAEWLCSERRYPIRWPETLNMCLWYGDLDDLKYLLKLNKNINIYATTSIGTRALDGVMYNKNFKEFLDFFETQRWDYKKRDGKGHSLLHCCLFSIDNFEYLLTRGFSPREKDNEGTNLLFALVRNSSFMCDEGITVFKRLIQLGVNPKETTAILSDNLLHELIRNMYSYYNHYYLLNNYPWTFKELISKAVSLLVEAGVNINGRAYKGETPLHRASGYCYDSGYDRGKGHGDYWVDVVEALLENGADYTLTSEVGANAPEPFDNTTKKIDINDFKERFSEAIAKGAELRRKNSSCMIC